MPTRPQRHPFAGASDHAFAVRDIPSRLGHEQPSRREARPRHHHDTGVDARADRRRDEDGSVATEYGLLAVVAATIVSVLLEWATSGGITGLLSSVLARVSELVGL